MCFNMKWVRFIPNMFDLDQKTTNNILREKGLTTGKVRSIISFLR